MASHRTSAMLWGVPGPMTIRSTSSFQRARRWNHPARVVVHRPRDDADLRPVLRSAIPTTNVLRMLCDLGAVDPAAVPDAVGHVLSARLATLGALEKTVIRHSERGRHGIVALRNAVQSWSIQGKPAASVLEKAMSDLFRRFRLPRFEFHPISTVARSTSGSSGTNILIECDGWTTHGLDRRQFEDDRRRDLVHTASGLRDGPADLRRHRQPTGLDGAPDPAGARSLGSCTYVA